MTNTSPNLGEEFVVATDTTIQTRMDNDAVKELLEVLLQAGTITEEQYKGCFKDIEFKVVRTTRLDPLKKMEFKVPSLANATIGGLIDMLGNARERMNVLKKEEGIYKDALEARQKTQAAQDAAVKSSTETQ